METIVPYMEKWSENGGKRPFLREFIHSIEDADFAGTTELQAALLEPDGAIATLLASSENNSCPAILYCGNICVHENGSEYVMALLLKRRSELAVEKYWLDDPMLPSLLIALRA